MPGDAGAIRKILAKEKIPAFAGDEKCLARAVRGYLRVRALPHAQRHRHPEVSSSTCPKEEQRRRFLDRLDDPSKNWKFSMADITEPGRGWNRYQGRCIRILSGNTSTARAPWYVVPADHKWFARVAIGSAIVSALEGLNLKFPRVDKASLQEFEKVREALENEGKGGRKRTARVVKTAKGG